MVPANTHSFICFNCDCAQRCHPLFGIFICGSCQRKVWYQLGTSNLIKCTKCGTVNSIPSNDDYPRNRNPYFPKNYEEISLESLESNNDNLGEKYFTQRHPM